MRDTSEPALERYYELLRARTPLARLTTAADLSSAVRQLAESSIRAAAPGAPAGVVRARLALRLYGREVAARLFPGVELWDLLTKTTPEAEAKRPKGAPRAHAALGAALCTRRDLNPHTLRYRNLNPARLPIPPLVLRGRGIARRSGVRPAPSGAVGRGCGGAEARGRFSWRSAPRQRKCPCHRDLAGRRRSPSWSRPGTRYRLDPR